MSKRWPGFSDPPGVTSVITWVSPRDPSYRGPGHPVDADAPARAEAAAADVLRRRQKEPNTPWNILVEEAARAHRVGESRIWPALRKRPEYKARPCPTIRR